MTYNVIVSKLLVLKVRPSSKHHLITWGFLERQDLWFYPRPLKQIVPCTEIPR